MLNKMILIGRLVHHPELQTTVGGKHLTRFTLAINRKYRGSDGERQTDFIQVVAWGKLAESIVSYATKGSLMSIDGELRTRQYEKNGATHYVSEVLCQNFQLLESRAQRALRENSDAQDLVDLILEEEALPF